MVKTSDCVTFRNKKHRFIQKFKGSPNLRAEVAANKDRLVPSFLPENARVGIPEKQKGEEHQRSSYPQLQ